MKVTECFIAHELFYLKISKKNLFFFHDTSPLSAIRAQRTVLVLNHCQSNVDTSVF